MNVYDDKGRKIALSPSQIIGQGGEAVVYSIGGGKALKLFKNEKHADFANDPEQQQVIKQRLIEHQAKLRDFPVGLPSNVVSPERLVTDQKGQNVLGYVMPLIDGAEVLLRYSKRPFRQQGISNAQVADILLDLYYSTKGVHSSKVVIGDKNDLNVLVKGNKVFLIDADSFQYGSYLCKTYTERFVDPLLCEFKNSRPFLAVPHNYDSDWYAFSVMLLNSLLYIDPYGGIYKPKSSPSGLSSRVENRMTIFHPDVKLPKAAENWNILPDDLLHYLQRVFVKDHRGAPPEELLRSLRWTTCVACGCEHAKATCPRCQKVAPASVKEISRVRGKVISTELFRTTGSIISIGGRNGDLRWLYHDGTHYVREDGAKILSGSLDPQMKFWIRGKHTIVGKGRQVILLSPSEPSQKIAVDSVGGAPAFTVNSRNHFWVQSGQLLRDGKFAPERIGDVLSNQTKFWVGDKFGFGFYRGGDMTVGFIFSDKGNVLNDTVQIPQIKGQLIDARAIFSDNLCWFFWTTMELGSSVHHCAVVNKKGSVEQIIEKNNDFGWISGYKGAFAIDNSIFVPTDEGIVEIRCEGGVIHTHSEFPDTEQFVDAESLLFAAKEGIYVTNPSSIQLLKLF